MTKKGFQLRSKHNGPFKMMGSSPAKAEISIGTNPTGIGNLGNIFKSETDLKNEAKIRQANEYLKSDLYIKSQDPKDLRGKVKTDHSPGADRTGKDNLQGTKVKSKLQLLKEDNLLKRTGKKIKEGVKKAGKYIKENRKEIGKGLEEAGQTISMAYGKGGTGSMTTANLKLHQMKKDDEYKRSSHETREAQLNKYKEGEDKLNETKSIASITNNNGQPTGNFLSTTDKLDLSGSSKIKPVDQSKFTKADKLLLQKSAEARKAKYKKEDDAFWKSMGVDI